MSYTILDWIYPPKCMGCKKIIPLIHHNGIFLCHKCYNGLHHLTGETIIDKPLLVKKNISSVAYNRPAKQLIFSFKFWGHPEYYKGLSKIMFQSAAENNLFSQINLIVPVPIHKTRLKERGYNQSQLLANEISKLAGIKTDSKILCRIKKTDPQNSLNYIQRQKNLANSITVVDNKKISGKNILIIDDILTTGTSINACAVELLNNGANSIFSLTLAIVLKSPSLNEELSRN